MKTEKIYLVESPENMFILFEEMVQLKIRNELPLSFTLDDYIKLVNRKNKFKKIIEKFKTSE